MKVLTIKIVTVMSLACLLAGCVSPNGQPDNTANGALIGGMSGAAIGALADRRAPGVGALIGGAAGLIAGGLIGHSADQQQAARARYYPPPPHPPPSIAEIKSMAKNGLSDDVIIGQIMSARAVYHLDANALIDLKNAGVSQKVIAYMASTVTTVASQPPPVTQTEVAVASPGVGYIWVGGEWVWSGGTWVWVGGRWLLSALSSRGVGRSALGMGSSGMVQGRGLLAVKPANRGRLRVVGTIRRAA